MAKEIIKTGKEKVQGRFETICSNCDCHFSFSKIDTYPHKSEDYGGGTSIDHYVDCPECSHSISVDIRENSGSSFMAHWSRSTVQNKVLKNINVQELRQTVDDSEFKLNLIRQLCK